MADPKLLYEIRGRTAWITLNRPDDLNCIDGDLGREIALAVEAAEADKDVRALVFTGAGRAFCAGYDLKYVLDIVSRQDPEEIRRFMAGALALSTRIVGCEKPVIAAVNGIAAAGGLELILSCDLAIAAEGVRIADAHANYGLLPGAGGSALLPRRIGPVRAKYLLYSGEFVAAETLRDWGLFNAVVPADKLLGEVEQLAAKITAKSPLVIRRMKHLVDDGLDSSLAVALRAETKAWEAHALAEDFMEGLTAFSEKREPDYKGR
ncbi:MAG: enoyl-CoA hydratase/isomerase family protein [Alphaproteobacteria bacterium]|nr:enoyl-CoA hydratase/isomerase family protein [Alphaproteobacteria bacterium]